MEGKIKEEYLVKEEYENCMECDTQVKKEDMTGNKVKIEHLSSTKTETLDCANECPVTEFEICENIKSEPGQTTNTISKIQHACKVCNYSTINKTKLTVHMRKHTGEKRMYFMSLQYK